MKHQNKQSFCQTKRDNLLLKINFLVYVWFIQSQQYTYISQT